RLIASWQEFIMLPDVRHLPKRFGIPFRTNDRRKLTFFLAFSLLHGLRPPVPLVLEVPQNRLIASLQEFIMLPDVRHLPKRFGIPLRTNDRRKLTFFLAFRCNMDFARPFRWFVRFHKFDI